MNNVSEEMKHLHKLAKRDPRKRFDHLWELATDPVWLMQAWEEIRSNKGSMTAGIDLMTATDIDPERIQKLSERLKTGRYRPKPVRRVYIAKSNGKMRPLGIPTLEDRIVQQALRMLMEPIFEADFYTCSHGFRSNRSTHTALRDVARMFQRTTWTIEGDIVGCFDNIPHGKLMKAVEQRIADEKVLTMIRTFLAAGYMEQWQYHRTYSGTPQGGVLTPPTILQTVFFRAGIAGVGVDPEHDVDLVMCDFYPFHQGPDHVPFPHPVGFRQPSMDLAGKIFQVPNDQLQFGLQGRGIRQLLALSFQVGDPLAQPGQAGLELIRLEGVVKLTVSEAKDGG